MPLAEVIDLAARRRAKNAAAAGQPMWCLVFLPVFPPGYLWPFGWMS